MAVARNPMSLETAKRAVEMPILIASSKGYRLEGRAIAGDQPEFWVSRDGEILLSVIGQLDTAIDFWNDHQPRFRISRAQIDPHFCQVLPIATRGLHSRSKTNVSMDMVRQVEGPPVYRVSVENDEIYRGSDLEMAVVAWNDPDDLRLDKGSGPTLRSPL